MRLSGQNISFSWGQKRGSKVSVLVGPLVANAVALRHNTSGYHGFGSMGTRYLDDVEAYILTENEAPAVVPEVAII